MFLHHNLIGIFWILMIQLFCFIPGNELPQSPFISFDKVFHVFIFAFLSFQLMAGLRKQYRFKKLRYYFIRVSLGFSLLFGVYTELMQGWFAQGRYADWIDMLANAIGSLLGWMLFIAIYQTEKRKKNTLNLELI